jgi:hypothetical protein
MRMHKMYYKDNSGTVYKSLGHTSRNNLEIQVFDEDGGGEVIEIKDSSRLESVDLNLIIPLYEVLGEEFREIVDDGDWQRYFIRGGFVDNELEQIRLYRKYIIGEEGF